MDVPLSYLASTTPIDSYNTHTLHFWRTHAHIMYHHVPTSITYIYLYFIIIIIIFKIKKKIMLFRSSPLPQFLLFLFLLLGVGGVQWHPRARYLGTPTTYTAKDRWIFGF